MSFSKSQKSKKKQKISEEKEEEEEEKASTTQKIFNSFAIFGKSAELRKSKRKLKDKQVLFQEDTKETNCDKTSPKNLTIELEDENSEHKVNPPENMNFYLLSDKPFLDSKETSEHDSQSNYSDYSYNILSDTSAISSDNIDTINDDFKDIEQYKNKGNDYEKTDSLSTIQSFDTKNSFETFTKSKSFSRKNSFKRTLKGMFRKANSEPQAIRTEGCEPPKLTRKSSEVTQKPTIPPKLFRKYSDTTQPTGPTKVSRKNSDPAQMMCEPSKLFRKNSEPTQKPYESTSKLFRKNSDSTQTPPVKKTSSIKKKISNFINMSEVSSSLTRSTSIRDIQKKAGKANSFAEWRTSFLSLVETDIGVSYQDMSFVNYDALNLCSYKDSSQSDKKKLFIRSHSMSMHNVRLLSLSLS